MKLDDTGSGVGSLWGRQMLRVSLCFLSKKIERRMMDEAIFWKIGGGDGENVVYSERLNFEEKKGKYIFRHHFCENISTEKKYFIDRNVIES